MPSISRPLADRALHFAIPEETRGLLATDLLVRSGRSARTLLKDGPLRITIVALGPGGHLASHSSPGPIAIQVVSGSILAVAGHERWQLGTGDLLSLAAGVDHEVASDAGGVFLLTVATAGDEPSP